MNYVLDCSVLVAWLFEDERTEQTEALFWQVKPGELSAPELLKYELVSVARKAVLGRRIFQDDVPKFMQIVEELRINYSNLEFNIFPTDVDAARIVVDLSLQYGLTTYDASYLEVALAKRLPLATLDAKLRKAAIDAGVDVIPKVLN